MHAHKEAGAVDAGRTSTEGESVQSGPATAYLLTTLDSQTPPMFPAGFFLPSLA